MGKRQGYQGKTEVDVITAVMWRIFRCQSRTYTYAENMQVQVLIQAVQHYTQKRIA
jgi:hypothetical protein